MAKVTFLTQSEHQVIFSVVFVVDVVSWIQQFLILNLCQLMWMKKFLFCTHVVNKLMFTCGKDALTSAILTSTGRKVTLPIWQSTILSKHLDYVIIIIL